MGIVHCAFFHQFSADLCLTFKWDSVTKFAFSLPGVLLVTALAACNLQTLKVSEYLRPLSAWSTSLNVREYFFHYEVKKQNNT